MADAVAVAPVYLAIGNIPVAFHSADLRNYFSQFIESGGFQCFHYRHRPELLRESEGSENPQKPVCGEGEEGKEISSVAKNSAVTENSSVTDNSSVKKQTVKSCCCIVSLHAKDADRLIKMYAGNHWINSKGDWLARRCVVKRVKVSHDKG